jgi:hypothetical protein
MCASYIVSVIQFRERGIHARSFSGQRDEYKLHGEFHDVFVQQLFPLLRVFDRQFPVQWISPNLEFISAQVSDRIFSGVIFDLEEGALRRQGLDRIGGELLTGLRLSQDRMKQFGEHGFPKLLKWLYESHGSLADRVRNSLTFFNRACDAEIEREELPAFIFAVIALESLFSPDPGTALRATLADSVALLTESSVEARIKTSKRLKKIYDHRSEIIHAGKHYVSTDDPRDSMQFCVRSLFEIVTHASAWNNAPDAALFDEIDREYSSGIPAPPARSPSPDRVAAALNRRMLPICLPQGNRPGAGWGRSVQTVGYKSEKDCT